jgi:hypothetical protein
MTHRPGLSGGVSRFLRGAEHLSCRGIGGKGGRSSLGPRDLTPCPSTCLFDRLARTVVSRLHLLEEVQYVLRTIGGPHCKKMMIDVL